MEIMTVIQEATEPNNDGVFTSSEFLWVLLVILIVAVIIAVFTHSRDWW